MDISDYTEIESRDSLEKTIVEADIISVVNDCNVAAAASKQFVLFKEYEKDSPVAIMTGNITKMRPYDAVTPF